MKNVLFINVIVIFLMADAKAAPVRAEEKAMTIECLKVRALVTEHYRRTFMALHPFENYWHPLLNVASGKNFTDAERFAALEAAVNDNWASTGFFTPGILSPNVIVMTTLTNAKLGTSKNGFITTGNALQMLREGVIDHHHWFWDGTHFSLRYAKDGQTGDASFDPGNPGPNDPKENVEWDDIFTWNGIPLFRWACLNPILTRVPNNPPPVENPPPTDNTGYTPRRVQTEGVNNSNNVATNVYVTIPASQQSGQVNYVPAPEKKQSPWGYVLAAVGGAIVGAALDNNRGYNNGYTQYPINTGYQGGDWRRGGGYINQPPPVYTPPRKYYNTSSLNPVLGTNQGGSPNNYRQGGSRNQQYYNGPLNGGGNGNRFVSYGGL